MGSPFYDQALFSSRNPATKISIKEGPVARCLRYTICSNVVLFAWWTATQRTCYRHDDILALFDLASSEVGTVAGLCQWRCSLSLCSHLPGRLVNTVQCGRQCTLSILRPCGHHHICGTSQLGAMWMKELTTHCLYLLTETHTLTPLATSLRCIPIAGLQCFTACRCTLRL